MHGTADGGGEEEEGVIGRPIEVQVPAATKMKWRAVGSSEKNLSKCLYTEMMSNCRSGPSLPHRAAWYHPTKSWA